MNLASLPSDLTGWTVIPDLATLRREFQASMGRQAGNRAADATPVSGWCVVFDCRLDGCTDGFCCERTAPDGAVHSVLWDAHQIRSAYPPNEKG